MTSTPLPGTDTSGLPPSRFQRQVWVGNVLDEIRAIRKTQGTIVEYARTQTYRERRLGYHGLAKRGEMYEISVSFSLENEGIYSEPLPSAEGNRLYQVRCALRQLQATPLVMGWALEWLLPAGWAFVDGLPATTYEEFVSNPTVVIRMVQSPENPEPAGFQVGVVGRYW